MKKNVANEGAGAVPDNGWQSPLLSCWIRPDICFAVSELSRFVSDPGDVHLQAAKRVLRYLKGTRELRLNYTRPEGPKLNQLWGYVDSDWAGCADTRKSTTGYVLMFNGAAISWKSKRQNVIALSSAEAEFMAASSLVQEVMYLRKLLERLAYPQSGPTPIFEDNRTCIAWSEGSVGGSDRAKHIDLRYHFVHNTVHDGILTLHAVNSADNVADPLTKSLQEAAFLVLGKKIFLSLFASSSHRDSDKENSFFLVALTRSSAENGVPDFLQFGISIKNCSDSCLCLQTL